MSVPRRPRRPGPPMSAPTPDLYRRRRRRVEVEVIVQQDAPNPDTAVDMADLRKGCGEALPPLRLLACVALLPILLAILVLAVILLYALMAAIWQGLFG